MQLTYNTIGSFVSNHISLSESLATGCIQLADLLVEQSWLEALPGEFQKPYAINLCKYVENQICTARNDLLRSFYPPQHLIFDAFNTTPFRSVKAVILCQGLSISVPEGVAVPTTVENIIHEVKQDLGYSNPSHGDPGYGNLEKWALQGVLFLNAVLTGNGNLANKNAHTKEGWENFTDAVVERISQRKDNIVFLVWGHYAKEKIRLIDGNKHHILKASHPTKYTFFNCKHFSETNKYLVKRGIDPIDWQL